MAWPRCFVAGTGIVGFCPFAGSSSWASGEPSEHGIRQSYRHPCRAHGKKSR